MLRVEHLTKRFGARALFEDVSLHVRPNDRIGLVGRNGTGKTTLLRMLAGLESHDDGTIRLRRGTDIGYLRQEIDPSSPLTVLEETRKALAAVTSLEAKLAALEREIAADGDGLSEELSARYDAVRAEFERVGGFGAEAAMKSTLTGLGMGPAWWDRPLCELSGGWLTRVELAKLMVARPGLLLLDEPTNHLDLPAIRWFEGVLASYPGAVVVVSHDRVFLDRHAERIVELEAARVTTYTGNYSEYIRLKALREGERVARLRNLDAKIVRMERFVARFGAKASKASQANSRKISLEKLRAERATISEPPRSGRSMKVRFQSAVRPGDVVLRLENVAKRYGDKTVYASLDLELRRGERVALVGPNGAGKSTLLRIAAGKLATDGGVRELGHNTNCAFYAQHQLDALAGERTVLAELESGASLDDRPRLRGILGAFLFSGDDVEKRVSVLSGGEKARLALAKLLLTRANFMVLDEPTNHLDMQACDVLIEALGGYDGTLLIVSHDRTFINALANQIVEVTPGDAEARVRRFHGNFDDYATALERDGDATPARSPTDDGPGSRKARRQAAAAERERTKDVRRLQNRVSELEAEIETAESGIEALAWRMAEPEVATDANALRTAGQEREARQTAIDLLYREWERAQAALETAASRLEEA